MQNVQTRALRKSVAVLFSNELMAAGLRKLVGQWPDGEFRYLSVRDPGTVEKLVAMRPDIVIIEASERERWEARLLPLLSRGLIVSIDMDRSTLNCYYVRRDVPATVQELMDVMGYVPETRLHTRASVK